MKKITIDTMFEVMGEFGFGRVVITMEALDWNYFDSAEITVPLLKNTVRVLWESVKDWNKDEYTSIESGGFEWIKRYNGAPLELRFIAEQVSWIGGDDA